MSRYSDTILEDNPSSYWRFNDGSGASTAADIADSNNLNVNALVEMYNVPLLPFGDGGYAHFAGGGLNDTISANVTGLTPSLGQTIEFWVKVDRLQLGGQCCVNYNPAAGFQSAIYVNHNGRMSAAWRVSGTWYTQTTDDIVIVTDKTQHIAAVFGVGGTIKVYVDGQQVDVHYEAFAPSASIDTKFTVGARYFSGAAGLRGDMSELAVYSYALTASQISHHYNVGINEFVEFDPPSLSYPNGGESILNRSIDITWHNTEKAIPEGDPAWHEIFFTENYLSKKQNRWLQIAQVPASTSTFSWTVPASVKCQHCRIGIRSRNHEGYRSRMSVSADNFTIGIKTLSAPTVISPNPGDVYKMFVPIVFDESGLAGTSSQRQRHEILYSSEDNEIDWTPVVYDLDFATNPVYWDVRSLPPGNDYAIRITGVDQQGNRSRSIFIRDLKISPSPVTKFIIDTVPPKGSVSIKNNIGFGKERGLTLDLAAFDETTGVKSVQIRERMEDSSGSLTVKKEGPIQDFSNIKTWFLTDEDGKKYVESIFRDYGENFIPETDSNRSFRDWLEDSNSSVSAIYVQSFNDGTHTMWSAFYDGDSSNLYKDQTYEDNYDGEVKAIAVYVDEVYLGVKDSEGKGKLLKYGNSSFEQSFSSNDSSVSALSAYGSNLYIGMDNGDMQSFDGTTFSSVSVPFSGRISHMFSDNRFLYVFVDHDDDIYIYDGSSFSTASLVDGSKRI